MPSNEPGPPTNGLSALTLFIASLSSVVAALVVRKMWGPGTLIGAAATPVIITLVAELLRKPAARITVVGAPPPGRRGDGGPGPRLRGTPTDPRPETGPYDPVAAGVAGLAAGAQPVFAGPSSPATTRSRRRVWIALTGGLVAFAVGAVLLTGSELLLGGSSVGSSSNRTTIFPGRSTRTTTTPTTTQRPSTTTTPATSTTTPPSTATPAPAPSGPTTSAPSTAPTTPAVPPPATTTAPAPSAAPPVP